MVWFVVCRVSISLLIVVKVISMLVVYYSVWLCVCWWFFLFCVMFSIFKDRIGRIYGIRLRISLFSRDSSSVIIRLVGVVLLLFGGGVCSVLLVLVLGVVCLVIGSIGLLGWISIGWVVMLLLVWLCVCVCLLWLGSGVIIFCLMLVLLLVLLILFVGSDSFICCVIGG